MAGASGRGSKPKTNQQSQQGPRNQPQSHQGPRNQAQSQQGSRNQAQSTQGPRNQAQAHQANPQPKEKRRQPTVDPTYAPSSRGNGRGSYRPTNKTQRDSNAVANGKTPNRTEAAPQVNERRSSCSLHKHNNVNAPSNAKKPERKDNSCRVKTEGGIPVAVAITCHRKNNHGKIKHSPNCLASIQMRLQKMNNVDKIQLVPVPVSFFKSNIKLASKGSAKIQKDIGKFKGRDGYPEIKTQVFLNSKASIDPPSSIISSVAADGNYLTIYEKSGSGQHQFPFMQCGTLDLPDSFVQRTRNLRMDAFQVDDDGFHSDGTETPPPSPSSGSSIASTSDHGSLESVDTGSAQRLAVLSFEQVRKLNDVMNEKVAIHGRGNFPTLEVTLKDLVTLVRKQLETDVQSGGAGMTVKDIRLNGGAASHVLASEDQPYNDLDLIFAVELSSNKHFDRVKSAVLNTLFDLLPEGVSRRRIMPCSLKEAYVGKMVKVNNNNDGDRWSLISLGNSPGHKNVELKFVDTMRRQFEFSVDSFQIVLDSLLLFYDCAQLPISENFYPTVVGESVYGDFQEALYHLQNKLISTRQPEEIRGGGLLKYCNLLVRNYQPVDYEKIKALERYMCSRFFIDFPDMTSQRVKLEAYLRNHFWGVEEEPLQYQYLMHLREVVGSSTVCLMGHERRQTLQLIQNLALQVLYREQERQQQQVAQQTQQTTLQSTHLLQTQPQSTSQSVQGNSPQSLQQTQQQATLTQSPQQIQIQAPPGLLYANGVYYAPVIPTTICTCNSQWLTTATIISPAPQPHHQTQQPPPTTLLTACSSAASPAASATSSVVASPVSSVIASPCISPYPQQATPEPTTQLATPINIIPHHVTSSDSISEMLVNYTS